MYNVKREACEENMKLLEVDFLKPCDIWIHVFISQFLTYLRVK